MIPGYRLPQDVNVPEGRYGAATSSAEDWKQRHAVDLEAGQRWTPGQPINAICGDPVWMQPAFGGAVLPFEWSRLGIHLGCAQELIRRHRQSATPPRRPPHRPSP